MTVALVIRVIHYDIIDALDTNLNNATVQDCSFHWHPDSSTERLHQA